MNQTPRQPLEKTRWVTVAALLIPLMLGAGAALADIQYERDGAVQNTYGGFDLPAQGTCPAAATYGYTGIDTRPECVAMRVNVIQTNCTSGNGLSWSTGVCNDTLALDQASCEAKPDRLWNPLTNICSIVMMDDDRNNVVCALLNGNWQSGFCTGAWVMPATTAYDPILLTGTGAGDQCLRCHNSVTQYNGPRVRDTEETMFMGHKNMARKVTVGKIWGGPPFECTVAPLVHLDQDACYDAGGNWVPVSEYPGTDSGQDLNWVTGQIDLDVTAGTNLKDLRWIYGDWLSAYPRAVYADDPDTAATPDKPKVSYSCGRCHTTGWTSDATLKANKEPEASFPGITWDGVTDATFGQVNLAGGVSGDTNKMSSWDEWGISCARCHGSAVDNSTNGGVPPFSAPTGMSSHHSDLTGPNAGSGYCTNSHFRTLATCNTNGGIWLTGCSVAGTCSDPAYTNSLACYQNAGTWTPTTDATACATAGGTFYASSCNLAGVCNDPAITLEGDCTGTVSGGPLDGLVRQWAAITDIVRCEDAGGHYTGTKTNRGQVITNLCMDCHRQETGGKPYSAGVNPATEIKVGVYHGTLTFLSHWHGNQYLNSPHGKFQGNFSDIPTAKFSYSPATPKYGSHFMNDGEAANTGNGCTGCHEVHTSTVTGKSPFREECTECHDKDVNQIVHPTGLGTPIESKSHPNEACAACHMPEGLHLFRINVDETYSTIPQTALSGTVNANTALDDGYPAVWVDLDYACGQCHGGGVGHVETTGGMTAGSPSVTVANSALFTVGQRIEVEGAGGYYYDDLGVNKFNDDLHGYIKAIPDGTTLTLTGNATATVSAVRVEQNPVKNGGAYFTKTQLAGYAKGIHNDKPIAYFSYKLGNPNTLSITVDASASTCSGSVANCNAFSWNWGDGSPNGSGLVATHTYAAAGTYPVTLTATQYSIGSGTRTVNVSVYTPDLPPVVGGTCTIDANTWVATVTDSSTDAGGIAQVVVNWGDNSVVSSDVTAPFGPFNHTYIQPGNFTVSKKVVDSIGQQSIQTCVLPVSYFSISGNVTNAASANVQLAAITVKRGLVTVRTVYTDASGNYTVGNLKPGTYSLTAKKTGLIFPVTPTSVTVGPNGTANFQSSN